MVDITSIHAQVIIAFSLTMIVVLLGYLAFFKDSHSEEKSGKRR